MAEKDINKIVIGEDMYNLRDDSVPDWAKEENKPTYTAEEVGAAPTSRRINNKPLSNDITLEAKDVGALPSDTVIPKIQYIPNESLIPETPVEGVLYLIGEIIEFTISCKSGQSDYQAEEGMTWAEWVESDYNDYITVDNNYNYVISGTYYLFNTRTSAYVVASDIIEPNRIYICQTGGWD